MANLNMTRADAKTYIARIIGGALSPQVIDMAEEALLRGFSDWQTKKDWEGLLKDTTLGFTVTGLSTFSATIPAPSASAFDAVNIGVTVTLNSVSGSPALAANTTVSSYVRGSTGAITSIVLSNAVTGSGTYSLTFSGDIPIIAGIQDYNLPADFYRPYDARLSSNTRWPLEYIRPRYWNRRVLSPATRGLVEAYTIYNTYSANTQNFGTKLLRVYRIPSGNDTLTMGYYRKLNALSDPIDMQEEFLIKFLDYCSSVLLQRKRAQDDPISYLKQANSEFEDAMTADEESNEDEDKRLISQMEMGDSQRPLWTNGAFNPDYGY